MATLSSRVFAAASFLVALAACDPPGSPAGASCLRASDCTSRFCLLDPSLGVSTCVASCNDRTACASGAVCGRFDFGEVDPDAALPVGSLPDDSDDVVRVCRPRLNVACATSPCAAGRECVGVGARAFCAAACTVDTVCASGTCSVMACGAPGHCALSCDSALECPSTDYCDPTRSDGRGHGVCLLAGADASVCADAATP